MKCVVLLLSLLSVGRSAPVSSCDTLINPITVSTEEVSCFGANASLLEGENLEKTIHCQNCNTIKDYILKFKGSEVLGLHPAPGWLVCVEFACSQRVYMGALEVLRLPPTV